jgi:hypothetical protein
MTPSTPGERPIFAAQAVNGDDVLFFASQQNDRVFRKGLAPLHEKFALRNLGKAINGFARLAGRTIHAGGANLRSLRPSRSRDRARVQPVNSTQKAPR